MPKIVLFFVGALTSGGFCFGLTQYSQQDYIAVSERFELIESNENYLANVVVKNFKYNRTHFGMNLSGTWQVDIDGPLMGAAQGYKFASNEYRLFPLAFPFDLCDVLDRNIFGVQNIYDCGNMFRCPIKKGHFLACNWAPDYTKFPPNIPKGRYMIALQLKYSGVTIAKYNWYTAIIDVPFKY